MQPPVLAMVSVMWKDSACVTRGTQDQTVTTAAPTTSEPTVKFVCTPEWQKEWQKREREMRVRKREGDKYLLVRSCFLFSY